jgi:hypothetical protein
MRGTLHDLYIAVNIHICLCTWTCSRKTALVDEEHASTERNGGSLVVYDIDATPLPEIPLPNDAAMRLDPTSPTASRINVGTNAYQTRP